ncbi:uncharacterized protein LOC124369263 [Homalodisca vitripennis]|uniref:uncharacterized protein LOC124369263 n=1 Tax=Homalodisca vitripennis TaxID=197043 RepID=UPI001EEA5CB8|nr:uncharacterized protein LOC124369263 [Homalodisca vitripennis]
MIRFALLLLIGLAVAARQKNSKQQCKSVKTIDISLNEIFCNQPVFLTLVEKLPEWELIDNVCVTLFPLPDDPSTFIIYSSRVYCDGSNEVVTTIATDITTGTYRRANPYSTFTQYVFGYAGCDTYLLYNCPEFGETYLDLTIFGTSYDCRPIGLSCLRKIEEIVIDSGLPYPEFYVLPMKLPNRCVTQQVCTLPPNPFSNAVSKYRSPILF